MQLLTHDIYLTGSSGFVGKNLIDYLGSQYTINIGNRNNPIVISESIVIHLAGKAHDLKKSLMPDEYYQVNTELTKKYFDAFLASNAKIFITLSSVKAVADKVESELNEDYIANPLTHYGKSKLLAEQYILSSKIPEWKRVYILRPCMIHGPGNKGNLNLLYKIVSNGLPWPLGAFENQRSFCSIENLCFIIKELISNDNIQSGVYNIADDTPISTNDLINLISLSKGKHSHIWKIPKYIIRSLSKLGDILRLPLNTERLEKLSDTYIVSNNKILSAINKPLPLTSKQGLIKTFNSFNTNA